MKPVKVHCIKARASIVKAMRADPRLCVSEGEFNESIRGICEVLVLDLDYDRKISARLKNCGPATSRPFSILATADSDDVGTILDAILGGADNYIDAKSAPDLVVATVLQTVRGESVVTQPVAARIKHLFHSDGPAAHEAGALEYKQKEILDHFAKGFLLQEVADTFASTPSDVRKELRKIYGRMQTIQWNSAG